MPRRQSQTNLEAWIDLASRLPWWAGILFAAVSYVGLHAVAQTPVASPSDLTGMSGALTWPTIRTIAGIGQYLLPVILLIGAALSAIEGHRKRRLLAESRQKAGTADLLDLTWQDFELVVGQTFRERGFRVTETASGPDGGVDLELRKDGELHLVQCKRWRARKVGVEIVRELYGVMSARGAVGGYVVTSGQFSPEARRFAAGRNIDLWDGAKLKAEIHGTKTHATAPATAKRAIAPGTSAPACPTCGAMMVRRTARRGSNRGRNFWGCSRFPDCRGTLPLAGPSD